MNEKTAPGPGHMRNIAKHALIAALLLEVFARHGVMVTLSLVAAGLAALKGSPVWLETRRTIWEVLKSRQPKKLWKQVLLLVLSADAILQQPGVALAVLAVVVIRWFQVTPAHVGHCFQRLGAWAQVLPPPPRRRDLEKVMILVLCLEAFGRLSRWLIVLAMVVAWLLALHRFSSLQLIRDHLAWAIQTPMPAVYPGLDARQTLLNLLQSVKDGISRIRYSFTVFAGVESSLTHMAHVASKSARVGPHLLRKAVTLTTRGRALCPGPKMRSLVEGTMAFYEGMELPSTGLARRRRHHTPEPKAVPSRDAIKVARCVQAARARWKVQDHSRVQKAQVKPSKAAKASRLAEPNGLKAFG